MAHRAGFVGLGNIGKPMAKRLVRGGLETTVYDVVDAPVRELVELGAKAAASPRELAGAADTIGICVRDDAEVLDVVTGDDGLLAGAVPGSVIAIHSTVLPGTVEAVAAAAAERDVGVVDACVTGGAALAEQGALTYMVGGDAEHIEQCRPAFETSAQKIVQAGALGNGARVKLCNNLMTYLSWTAAYEGVCLARAVGLPQEVLDEVTLSNGIQSEPMQRFLAIHKLPDEARRSEGMQKILRGHAAVAEKDLAWTLQLAREAGVKLPGTALASQLMAQVYGLEDEKRR
jgi:3-hydroxyisobutyrate dehydrogenase-like beta-hydroxyacid dehydrogenase